MADPQTTELEKALYAYHQTSDAMVKGASQTFNAMFMAQWVVPWVRTCGDLAVSGIESLAKAAADYLAAQEVAAKTAAENTRCRELGAHVGHDAGERLNGEWLLEAEEEARQKKYLATCSRPQQRGGST